MTEHAETPKLIKQYAGSRLYDIHAARYVCMEDIADMVRAQERIRVLDTATGRDITEMVLAQIIASYH